MNETKHNVPIQSLIDHIKTATDIDPWAQDMAEELLKKQEPKPVELYINVYGTKFYFCPKCKRELFHTHSLNFCEMCGQAVTWE